jgi:hypothetical protein
MLPRRLVQLPCQMQLYAGDGLFGCSTHTWHTQASCRHVWLFYDQLGSA